MCECLGEEVGTINFNYCVLKFNISFKIGELFTFWLCHLYTYEFPCALAFLINQGCITIFIIENLT